MADILHSVRPWLEECQIYVIGMAYWTDRAPIDEAELDSPLYYWWHLKNFPLCENWQQESSKYRETFKYIVGVDWWLLVESFLPVSVVFIVRVIFVKVFVCRHMLSPFPLPLPHWLSRGSVSVLTYHYYQKPTRRGLQDSSLTKIWTITTTPYHPLLISQNLFHIHIQRLLRSLLNLIVLNYFQRD